MKIADSSEQIILRINRTGKPMDFVEPEPSEDEAELDTTIVASYSPPTIGFSSLGFSDGSLVEVSPSDVLVLVGPNNAGKSLALRELQTSIGANQNGIVITQRQLTHSGTATDFIEYVRRHGKIDRPRGSFRVRAPGLNITTNSIEDLWPGSIGNMVPLFCASMLTETRIGDSNPASAFAPLDEIPSHPIQLLYSDEALEHRISRYFYRAFGLSLFVFRLGGNNIPLLVGSGDALPQEAGRLSLEFNQRLRDSTVPLSEQGDGMRSFASVILHLLAPATPSILLLDEPEAFLHPPQAKLLGEVIASERPTGSQLFVATHSPDVLQGLVNVASEHLRVLRMQRVGDVNRVRELNKDLMRRLSIDPLMKHSNVLSGVFHQRVIVCEADADCMFYGSLLDQPTVHGSQHPDVLFVQGNGKDRLAALAETLAALDVKTDVIVDMDVLKTTDVLKDIVLALQGDWNSVKPLAESIKTEVEQRWPLLSGAEIKKGIDAVLSKVPSDGPFPEELSRDIRAQFRKADPWENIKASGALALPSGQATVQFQELQKLCRAMGLWIVPVGELEGFCKSVGNHGPRWVRQVLQNFDLANDMELEQARAFIREIWGRN